MMHAYAEIGFNPSSPAAIFLFLLVTLFVNSILRLAARPLALSRADLVLVYAMMLMSLTVPTWGFLFFLFGTMVWPFYHATPENRFGEMYLDWIPEWIAPNDLTAIKHYYEGLPEGMPLQWDAWLEPLANWFLFFLVIGFMLICLSAIFHRQWSSHERLTYPMMQLPERMIEEDGRGLIAPFFRDRTMWIGFSIPFCLFSLAGLHHFHPVIPAFPFHHGHIPLAGPTVNLPIVFSFAWVGFFFLVNLDITFSIWFFFVLFKIEKAVFTTLGIAGSEVLSAYEGGGHETDITHQATGAAIVFVLLVVWSARGHLKEAALKAWSGARDPADADELMSYRTAVAGFAAGMVFFALWLWRTGVPAVIIPIVLFVGLCWYVFITRVVTGAGVASARGPLVQERNPGDPPGGEWELAKQPRVSIDKVVGESTAHVVDFCLGETTLGVSRQLLGGAGRQPRDARHAMQPPGRDGTHPLAPRHHPSQPDAPVRPAGGHARQRPGPRAVERRPLRR